MPKPDILFSEKGQWNYFTSTKTLTGANIERDLKFFANQDTYVKQFSIFNGETDATYQNYGYVLPSQGSRGIVMGLGPASNYGDYICNDSFVIPNGYYFVLSGVATALGYVGFSIVYKGGLSIISDELSAP